MSMDPFNDVPPMPRFEEEAAKAWAAWLVYMADELGAPSFAADCAKLGYQRAAEMAERWIDADLEPAAFADELRAWTAS